MKNYLSLIALLGCSIATTVAATDPWHDDKLSCETPGRFPVDQWTIAGLAVGTNTLADVRTRLGDAPIERPTAAENGRRVLCYRLQTDRVAVFESGALAPRDGEITAMALLDPSEVPFLDRCPIPTGRSFSVHPASTAPRAKRTKFEKVVGASHCDRSESTTTWAFLSQEGDWSTMSGLKARFVSGRLRWWYVYQVTSQ